MTRTEARQMSGPVPSPSMKGRIGLSGTTSVPLVIVIFAPSAGGVAFGLGAVDMQILLKDHRQTSVTGRAMLAQGPRHPCRVPKRCAPVRNSGPAHAFRGAAEKRKSVCRTR